MDSVSLDVRLKDHIARVQSVLSASNELETITARVASSTSLLVRREVTIDDKLKVAPESGNGRVQLHHDEEFGFVVMAMIWPAGVGTPIHDHGTWGVAGVCQGEVTVTDYQRTDCGEDASKATINEVSSVTARVGEVKEVFPPNSEIHKVENVSDSLAISIHTYGELINEYNVYDSETGDITKAYVG